MKARWMIGLTLALAMLGVARAASAGTFDSGSTGAQGAFPPTNPPPGGTVTITLNLNTGVVTYLNAAGQTISSDTLPNVPPGGFQTGVLHFTSVAVPAGVTLRFLRNTSNTPVTLLAQTDNPPTVPSAVTIVGTIDIRGAAGGDAVYAYSLTRSGGGGGPGGGDGAGGARGVSSWSAGAGVGPGAGGGGDFTNPHLCSGGGAGFATGGTSPTSFTSCSTGAGGLPYGNHRLLPLLGGSGGGGGGGNVTCNGGGGGGGGGTILIASSGTITFNNGTINANGGGGGNGGGGICPGGFLSGPGAGGGGSGGAVRLVANTIIGTGSSNIFMAPGNGGSQGASTTPGGNGGYGRIRLEAYSFTGSINLTLPASVGTPTSLTIASGPTLTITSVAGVNAPPAPTGRYETPDVTLATAPGTLAVALAASQIPLGTTVKVRVTPHEGPVSTAMSTGLAGTLQSSTATASVTHPTYLYPALVDAGATFNLGAWLDSPIKYAGEDVTTATVTASLSGPSQVRYFTASGKEVPSEAIAALGLPR